MKKIIFLCAVLAVPAFAQVPAGKKAPPTTKSRPPAVKSVPTPARPIPASAPKSNIPVQPEVTLTATPTPKQITPEGGPSQSGSWKLRTIVDPMSDATRGIATTAGGESIRLVVKCDTNGNETIYFSFISSDYLGEGRYAGRDFTYRIDGSPPRTMRANHDARTASVLLATPISAGGRFLKELSSASRLTVELTSYDYKSYVAVIDVTGAKEAFNYVAKTCKDAPMEQFLNQ